MVSVSTSTRGMFPINSYTSFIHERVSFAPERPFCHDAACICRFIVEHLSLSAHEQSSPAFEARKDSSLAAWVALSVSLSAFPS